MIKEGHLGACSAGIRGNKVDGGTEKKIGDETGEIARTQIIYDFVRQKEGLWVLIYMG